MDNNIFYVKRPPNGTPEYPFNSIEEAQKYVEENFYEYDTVKLKYIDQIIIGVFRNKEGKWILE